MFLNLSSVFLEPSLKRNSKTVAKSVVYIFSYSSFSEEAEKRTPKTWGKIRNYTLPSFPMSTQIHVLFSNQTEESNAIYI